ncbi:MAG: hypothetical protein ACPGMR_08475 [Pontibacterium sp.]
MRGQPPAQPLLPGYEAFHRYWVNARGKYGVKLKLGECYVTRNDEVIMTTLGSCISVCMRDPAVGIGGMNHFILPASADSHANSPITEATRYGTFAMEELVNGILRFGGRRERLEAKVTGGGRVIASGGGVGAANIEFIQEYMDAENLPVLAWDVGGDDPRQVIYLPREGRMLVKRMGGVNVEQLAQEETSYRSRIERTLQSSDVELF